VVVVACDDLLAVAIARADEEKEEEEVAGDKRFRTTVPSSKVALKTRRGPEVVTIRRWPGVLKEEGEEEDVLADLPVIWDVTNEDAEWGRRSIWLKEALAFVVVLCSEEVLNVRLAVVGCSGFKLQDTPD